jgi:hypothetical protein
VATLEKQTTYLENALPVLDPIIALEETGAGWRGLTAQGEILGVRSNGSKAELPTDDVLVMRDGEPVGRRMVEPISINIGEYLERFNSITALHAQNQFTEALEAANATMAIAPTLYARFNRAQVLLALGNWPEGFSEFDECERHPAFARKNSTAAAAAGLKRWRGEPLHSKKILLIHDHGFGDSIQNLRFVPRLRMTAATVRLMVPLELLDLARQIAPVSTELEDADYFCPLLFVPGALNVLPGNVPSARYLSTDDDKASRWRARRSPHRTVGLAWSVGLYRDGEYPREIPLEMLVDKLGGPGVHLISLQTQGEDEARALGVEHTGFESFDDLAAAMTAVDQIISVDTAALHLAGAIGHRNVIGLLSHWHSWRWLANWYSGVRLIRQTAPGDWDSALAQI